MSVLDLPTLTSLRDPDRGRRNLAALAAHVGSAAFVDLAEILSRVLHRAPDPDMALNNLETPARPADGANQTDRTLR